MERTQFLVWDNGRIIVKKDIPDNQRRKIAGEGIDIIKLGEFRKPTFFVEDSSHREIIENIAGVLGKEVSVTECGSSSNVVSLFKLSLREGRWPNSFFLIDGDNQGNPFPKESQFIHLEKYCMHNYLLDFEIAAAITGKSIDDIQRIVFDSIKASRDTILKKNKFLDFLFDRLDISDITDESLSQLDCSEVFPGYLKEIDMTFSEYVEKYVKLLSDNSKLEAIFPQKLLAAIKE